MEGEATARGGWAKAQRLHGPGLGWGKDDADIVPDEPAWVEIFGAVAHVEAARGGVFRLDVNTDPGRVLRDEPCRQLAKQFGGNAGAATLWNHVDPLQFPFAAVAAREVPGDEADNRILIHIHRDVTDARGERLPRMVLVVQVARKADAPELLDAPVGGANARHRGDVGFLC